MTKTAQTTIPSALEAGNSRAATAQAAGIAPDTLRTWMRQGEQQATGRYKTLARTVEQVEAQGSSAAAEDKPSELFMSPRWTGIFHGRPAIT